MPARFQLPWSPFIGFSVTCLLCTGVALFATGVLSRKSGPLCGPLAYLIMVVAQSNTFLRFLPGGYLGQTAAVEGSVRGGGCLLWLWCVLPSVPSSGLSGMHEGWAE